MSPSDGDTDPAGVTAARGERLTRRWALPNLVVIGGKKCGTSALHYYLGLHPEISMSSPKELDFFVDPSVAGRHGNWLRGVDWYVHHFPATAPVRGETSPSYTSPSNGDVPERMASVIPEAKLIFMVRDPIERAISDFMHRCVQGKERREANVALIDPDAPYIARSRYHAALERYVVHFPRAHIRVVAQEDLHRDRAETMRSLYRFLGVDEGFVSPKFDRERHQSSMKVRRHDIVWRLSRLPVVRLGYKLPDDMKWTIERLLAARRPVERPSLDPSVLGWLREQLTEDTASLRRLTGKSFSDWSV